MPHDAPCREQHLPCAAGQKPASTHRATVKVGPLRCMLRIVETSGTTLMVQPSTPSRWGPWNLRLHCSSKLLAHCGFTANVPPARSSLIQSWKKGAGKLDQITKNLKTKNGMNHECLDSGYSSSMLNRFVEYLGQVLKSSKSSNLFHSQPPATCDPSGTYVRDRFLCHWT